jgi:hypothetical protein
MGDGEFSESWGPDRFGDPCRECGLAWSFGLDEAIEIVMGSPDSYRRTIGSASGGLGHPDLGWTLGAYVCHVGDNLGIWAQWLAGAALESETAVPGYDDVELSRARYYTRVPLGGSLWHLEQATNSWSTATGLALAGKVVLNHETRGPQSATDVIRSNAHDAFHHEWDISRIISYNSASQP